MSEAPICVVGVSGFVGSHVAAQLLAQGRSVVGALRRPDGPAGDWLRTEVAARAKGGATLRLTPAEAYDQGSFEVAFQGCGGVIMCAGAPDIVPPTIPLMVALASHVCAAAEAADVPAVVFTSSTGSTNPPDGEPPIKREMTHWSDYELQLRQRKYAAVGKTLLDKIVLNWAAASGGALRCATINPTGILGPCFSPEPVGSLKGYATILQGRRMADRVPNSAISMIHVEDLAALHIAALDNPHATGRYFGVKRSWHWRDILAVLEKLVPGYTMPPVDPDEVPITPTQFDLSRQASLGVPIRDLPDILAAHVEELCRREMIELT